MAHIRDYRASFVKYFLVFLVPIAVFASFFVYQQYFGEMEKSRQYTLSRLEQFSQEIDLFYSSLQDMALSLSREEFLPGEEPDREIDSHFASQLYRASQEFGDDVLVLYYPRYGQRLFVGDEIMSYSAFESSSLYDVALSVSGLYTRLCNVMTSYYLPIRAIDGSAKYSTAVLFPMPMSGSGVDGTLCFLVRSEYFDRLHEQYFPYSGSQLLIFNVYSDCIYMHSALEMDVMEDLLPELSRQSVGIQNVDIGEHGYVTFKSRSARTGFSYMVIADSDEVYADSMGDFRLLILIIASLLVFSALISFIIAKKYYLTLFKEREDRDKLSRSLVKKTILIKEMVILKLIDGTIRDGDETSLKYNLRCANMSFDLPLFTIFLLETDTGLDVEHTDILLRALNVTRKSEVDLFAIQLEEKNLIVILANHAQSADRDSIASLVSTLASEESGMLRLYVGLSHDSPFLIDASYIEASSIREREPLDGNGVRFFIPRDSAKGGFSYPQQEEDIIQQAVRNGSYDIAKSALYDIFTLVEAIESPQLARALCYDLVNHIARMTMSEGLPFDTDQLERLTNYSDLAWLKDELSVLLEALAAESLRRSREEKEKKRHDLIIYVQEHYRDQDLSLDKLASLFNLSFFYIGKVFKDETGTNFKNYITELRFSYVKERLRSSDDPIKDIINDAGYMDVANYMRKFKQHEGVTPGGYRAQYRR